MFYLLSESGSQGASRRSIADRKRVHGVSSSILQASEKGNKMQKLVLELFISATKNNIKSSNPFQVPQMSNTYFITVHIWGSYFLAIINAYLNE